jgi:hypothetical protein
LLDNQLKTEAIFTEALHRAQARGEMSDKQDPVARFFVATIQGMRATAKLHSDRKALEHVAKTRFVNPRANFAPILDCIV